MKRAYLFLGIILVSVSLLWAQDDKKYTVLLSGASFAAPGNEWFEMGCCKLDVIPINRAISSEAILHTANKMAEGKLYSEEEFDEIDVFVLMHVHERDVYNSTNLKENYTDYKLPFDYSDYAICYDYVIKRYLADCYNQQFNPESKYYGKMHGKPATIVLCTHWHDGRPVFNRTVRQLAEKWGLLVVEFDKYIGFSRKQLHPATGKQTSLIFTADSTVVNGEAYGWHPLHGEHSFIQQRMAAIFAHTLGKILY